MKGARHAVAAALAAALAASAGAAAEPVQRLDAAPIAPPVDHPFAGVIQLDVDATDVAHRLFVVRERVPVQHAGPMTLLYPRWEAASHGPSLTVAALAGLRIAANGRSLGWRRDEVDPHAFHLDLPEGVAAVEISFQIVADADQIDADMVAISWQRLLLYPAGWYARNIALSASVRLPIGLSAASALDAAADRAPGPAPGPAPDPAQATLRFAPVSLERLLDSPLLAGRYSVRIPLDRQHSGTVTLDLVAPRPEDLAVPPERVEELRRMVAQARALFGAAPFGRYEILARMRDDGASGGTEHRRSSEIAMASAYFRDWAGQLNNRDIVAHEFVHAWNGAYRVPADLWAPTPNVPEGGSLLWVYEGQTEFWARLLAARAGLRTHDETLDKLALDAAEIADRPGRAWRPLSDDVNYPSFMLHQPIRWRDWQRRKDYYLEGVMLWLDVAALVRERSGGRHGLDDVARAFFAAAAPDAPARTYAFDDLCAALNRVAPFDWAGFLHRWIDGHGEIDPSEGLARLGWRLAFGDRPSATFVQNEAELGGVDLSYAIGLVVADDGRVRSVGWDKPAFRAGLAPGVRIVAVAGAPFTRAALQDAVRNSGTTPVRLSWEQDGRSLSGTLDYAGGLRYPRLERIAGRPDGLAVLFTAR